MLQRPGYISMVFLTVVYSGSVFAGGATRASTSPISAPDILNLIFGLLIVIIIFLCVAWFLKRLTGGNIASRGYLKVVDTLHLGTREKIILVRAVDSYLVLGISPGNINSLHVVQGQLPEEPSAAEPDFKTRLRGMLGIAGGSKG